MIGISFYDYSQYFFIFLSLGRERLATNPRLSAKTEHNTPHNPHSRRTLKKISGGFWSGWVLRAI
jgi:hypothetical protein